MRLDQLYVRHRSLWLDLDTLLWTALILMPKIGSYEPPERLLFVGPISHFVQRYVNWFMADFLVTLVAVGSVGLLWRTFGPLNVGWPKSVAAALVLALLFSVTGAVLGVNRTSWTKATAHDEYDLLLAWAVAAVLAYVVNLLVGVLPHGLVLMASGLALCGFVAVRYRGRLATGFVSYILRRRARARSNRERVLIVGSGESAQCVAWILDRPGNAQRFRVFGFVDNDLSVQGMRVYGANVAGTHSDIPKLLATHNIRVIILADHGITPDQQRSIAELCQASKTRFVLMPNLVDTLSDLCKGSLSAGQIGGDVHDIADLDCLDCLARRDAQRLASVSGASEGTKVL
jgi:FlaA1/EpsC-like NDP-sugar epimerase